MQLQSHKSLGYTLIEILVAMTITALLFAAGYAGYRAFAQRQVIAGASRALKSNLRLAQELALQGKKPVGCTSLSGYRAKIAGQTYDIVAVCNNGGVATEISIGKDGLAYETGISAATTAPAFMFKVIGQGTDIAGGSVVITLTQANTGSTQTVTVTNGGDIK